MSDQTLEKPEPVGSSSPSPWAAYKPPNHTYLKVGGAFSAVYVLGFALYAFAQLDAFLKMTPDDLAAFLSGVFAPLAFLWLVLGFMQQGEELKQSSHALWLQGEELRASVEQQRELVNVTREQLQFESDMLRQQREELERNSQPKLSIIAGGGHGTVVGYRLYQFWLLNHGKACTGLQLYYDGQPGTVIDALPSGGRLEFGRELPVGEFPPFVVQVDYLDERLIPGSKSFQVAKVNEKFQIAELREITPAN
jgi:hypothetical protein